MLTIIQDTSPATLAAIAEEKQLRKTNSFILVFSMGSQFDHLICLQLAKLGVFCKVADPARLTAGDVRAIAPQGIIVSGGPASVHAEPPPFDTRIFDLQIPVLGICLGMQMAARYVGASVHAAAKREFSVEELTLHHREELFEDVPYSTRVLQSHGDIVLAPSWENERYFTVLGATRNASIAAFHCRNLWGVQFHPEVGDTEDGLRILENFCRHICGIADRYPVHDVVGEKITSLRRQIAGKRVLIALSGGSDSSVCAYLLKYAAGRAGAKLRGIYIKGVDRPDDEADVIRFFGNQSWIELKVVDATELFLGELAGRTSGPEKRAAFRNPYQDVLEEEAEAFGANLIVQGTLYTDLVESGQGYATGARRATIKQHHNTGLRFSIPELAPLADCVKDTARGIGRAIGMPQELLCRHPFPGPGLVIRIEGEVTAEKLAIARAADRILIEELRQAGLYEAVWQAGARVLSSMHTTSKGDDAGKGYIIQLFAVSSANGFTARPYPLSWDLLERIDARMGSEIPEVGATDYRISGKPYATIEGE